MLPSARMSEICMLDVPLWLLQSVLPGCAGGTTAFLHALHRGHYRNNHHMRKLAIEISGASLTALCLAPLFFEHGMLIALSFAIGLTWASIIQVLRNRITAIVDAALAGKPSESN
jgi:ABC-type uncharacterized transport system permease subunit